MVAGLRLHAGSVELTLVSAADMTRFENIACAQARKFYVAGLAVADLEQEGRIALLRCPIALSPALARIVVRRRLIELLRSALRRGEPLPLTDTLASPDRLEENVLARLELETIVSFPYTASESEAIGRALRGEPIGYPEKRLSVALTRARRKLGRSLS